MPIFTGGKTTGFDRDTFLQAFIQSGVPSNTAEKRIDRMASYKDRWFELIDSSFLPEDLKSSYKNLITTRLSRL
jgi:serine/threonine-protein kinase HipA